MQDEWRQVDRKPGISPWLGLVTGLWCVFVFTVVIIDQIAGKEVVVCWFRALTGVPCPTCGSTRALLALAQGRVIESFTYNPMFVAVALLGTAWLVARFGFGRTLNTSLGTRSRRIAWLFATVLFLANWSYVIAWHLIQASEAG